MRKTFLPNMKKFTYLALILLILIAFYGVVASAQTSTHWEKGRFAYVTNEGDNNLLVIDLKTEKTVATLKTGKTPPMLWFLPMMAKVT